MPIDPLSARSFDPALRPERFAAPPARPAGGPDFRALMGAAGPADRVELSPGIPSSPPPEVLEQIQVAGQVAEELHARGRELRFSNDSRTGQLVIEVRDLDGKVLSRIPPTEAMAIASGSFR